MLGWIGKWASSKGMGRIPSLVGLSRTNARTAITNAGFNLGTETPLGNAQGATALNNGTAKDRSDVNQLLNYEEVLGFEYYEYVAPPFFPPTFSTPFFPPTFNPPFFPFFPFFPPYFVPPFFPPFFPFFPSFTGSSLTYCPTLGRNVPTSGYPGNCPGMRFDEDSLQNGGEIPGSQVW